MAKIITMPRLSDTMTEGTVASWLKNVGDKIEEGDIIAEIETDKATMEFESFDEGYLLYIGIQQGGTAVVDSLLAIIGDENEDITALLKGNTSTETVNEEKATETVVEASSSVAEIPAGVKVITMPRLSDTMTEGTVASWLKSVGDKIEEGDIIAEIETDKATMEFESFDEGYLLYIGIQEGGSAPVDSLLAIIGDNKDTDVSAIVSSGGAVETPAVKQEVKAETKTSEPAKVEENVEVKTSNTGRIFASPLAKKMAKDKKIDLSLVKATGSNNRIVKSDIENYKPADVKTTESKCTRNSVIGETGHTDTNNSQMRKIIAKRLGESKFTAPHYYLSMDIEMSNAITSRKAINSIPDTKVSFNDMVLKASAMALKKHPQVNSQWFADKIRVYKHVNIGVAVAVPDGLVVPVVNNTDLLTMTQIGGTVKELAGKAKNKKLSPAEMEGSTFTVSNLGMFGITEFTSIINQPNSAILSVGAIVAKPVVKDAEIVVGNVMTVTLACDHRTVDGATGAAFLQTLKQYLENPVTMLA
ncbi:MAG: 2-oxo acid dehydrogenase subunit E2 [Flavobacteriaceae bacterium]|nr:2-oxo acid dehydrogenase subunit E2 [Flavobacteriaceae bacterium]